MGRARERMADTHARDVAKNLCGFENKGTPRARDKGEPPTARREATRSSFVVPFFLSFSPLRHCPFLLRALRLFFEPDSLFFCLV